MQTTLITGASRGLGLELARQYAAAGDRVIATCRHPEDAQDLRALADGSGGRVSVHALDVSDDEAVAALAATLSGEPVDILINNAGVFPDKGMAFGSMRVEPWLTSFRVNAIAPLKVSEAFVEHVARSERKVIAVVTSLMGSLADNSSGGYYAYRSSKAAANMVVRSMAIDLAERGIACVLLHPGWVQTDMGGEQAPLAAHESVSGMRKVLGKVGRTHSGRFFKYDGTELNW